MSENKPRASEDTLGGLHEQLAQVMIDEVAGYRSRGEPVPPALLANIIKFLKDNKIECVATQSNPIGSLAESLTLPFPTDQQLRRVK